MVNTRVVKQPAEIRDISSRENATARAFLKKLTPQAITILWVMYAIRGHYYLGITWTGLQKLLGSSDLHFPRKGMTELVDSRIVHKLYGSKKYAFVLTALGSRLCQAALYTRNKRTPNA